jgi:hypothetical protein
MRTKIHLLLILIVLLIAAAFYSEWRSSRRDANSLKSQLARVEQSVQQATANQQQRDKQLDATLAQLEALKLAGKSPQDIQKKLPSVLPLPKPLVTSAGRGSELPTRHAIQNENSPAAPQTTTIPPEDLKPLYDFAVDCKACQAKLAAVSADLADEKTKTQAISRERDAALQTERGGSLRQRIKRSAKWFLVGVAVGAVAAKAH